MIVRAGRAAQIAITAVVAVAVTVSNIGYAQASEPEIDPETALAASIAIASADATATAVALFGRDLDPHTELLAPVLNGGGAITAIDLRSSVETTEGGGTIVASAPVRQTARADRHDHDLAMDSDAGPITITSVAHVLSANTRQGDVAHLAVEVLHTTLPQFPGTADGPAPAGSNQVTLLISKGVWADPVAAGDAVLDAGVAAQVIKQRIIAVQQAGAVAAQPPAAQPGLGAAPAQQPAPPAPGAQPPPPGPGAQPGPPAPDPAVAAKCKEKLRCYATAMAAYLGVVATITAAALVAGTLCWFFPPSCLIPGGAYIAALAGATVLLAAALAVCDANSGGVNCSPCAAQANPAVAEHRQVAAHRIEAQACAVPVT